MLIPNFVIFSCFVIIFWPNPNSGLIQLSASVIPPGCCATTLSQADMNKWWRTSSRPQCSWKTVLHFPLSANSSSCQVIISFLFKIIFNTSPLNHSAASYFTDKIGAVRTEAFYLPAYNFTTRSSPVSICLTISFDTMNEPVSLLPQKTLILFLSYLLWLLKDFAFRNYPFNLTPPFSLLYFYSKCPLVNKHEWYLPSSWVACLLPSVNAFFSSSLIKSLKVSVKIGTYLTSWPS